MLPDLGLLMAVAAGVGVGGAVVLLSLALRGVRPNPARPGRRQRAVHWVRSLVLGPRAAVALTAGVLVLVLTRWPVASAGVTALVLAWPFLFGGARAEQRDIAQLEALVVWTESLRDTISANVSLEQAIAVSTQPGRAPLLLQPALDRLAGQMRVRTPLDAALLNLAGELDVPGADMVIAALVLNVRRRGDRLKQVLSGLCTTAREELDLRRRISAGRAGLRRSVQIIVVVTVVIAGYLTAFGGTFMSAYDTASGQVALAVVAGFFAAGFIWMRSLATSQETEVILTRPDRPADPAHAQIVAALTGLGPQNAPPPAFDGPIRPSRDRPAR